MIGILNKLIRNNKGGTLLIVLVVMVVLLLLGTTLLDLGVGEAKMAAKQEGDVNVHFIARAGAEAAAEAVLVKKLEENPFSESFGSGFYDVTVKDKDGTILDEPDLQNKTEIWIESVGTINGVNQTYSDRVTLLIGEDARILEYALFAQNSLNTGNSPLTKVFYGPVGYGGSEAGRYQDETGELGDPIHDEDLQLEPIPSDDWNDADNNVTEYLSISGQNENVTIDTEEDLQESSKHPGVYYILTNTVDGKGEISFTGSGEIRWLVTDTFNTSGNQFEIKTSPGINLIIYYEGTNMYVKGNTDDITATIYAPNATLHLKGGGGPDSGVWKGAWYTKNVDLSGGNIHIEHPTESDLTGIPLPLGRVSYTQ